MHMLQSEYVPFYTLVFSMKMAESKKVKYVFTDSELR